MTLPRFPEYSRDRLRAEIAALVQVKISIGEPVVAEWFPRAFLAAHQDITGPDAALYERCAWDHIPKLVRDVLRDYAPEEHRNDKVDRQIVLPGFERLQLAYLVQREKRSVLVPIHQLTEMELRAKEEEYHSLARGLREHALEIRRFREEKFEGKQTA